MPRLEDATFPALVQRARDMLRKGADEFHRPRADRHDG
jgi:hypothetical protein